MKRIKLSGMISFTTQRINTVRTRDTKLKPVRKIRESKIVVLRTVPFGNKNKFLVVAFGLLS